MPTDEPVPGREAGGYAADPHFWRAGAIAATLFMSAVLAILTVNTLRVISPGGAQVPPYQVINHHIGYEYDGAKHECVPEVGAQELLFGRVYDESHAAGLIAKGKLVIQSRACMDCHTFFGNGAYYAPDLTKAWLDPDWEAWQSITGTATKEDAMVAFLKDPEKYATWTRKMPNMHLSDQEARALVAYLK